MWIKGSARIVGGSQRTAGLSQLGPKFLQKAPIKPFFLQRSRNKHLAAAFGWYPRSQLPSDHPARLMYYADMRRRSALKTHGKSHTWQKRAKPSLPKFKCLDEPYIDPEDGK